VACPVTLAQSAIGQLVPLFMAKYPHVKIDMRVSNRAVDLVEEGIDVALRVRQTLDASGSLVIKNFGMAQTLLAASPALLARQGQPQTPEDLFKLDTVSLSAADGRAGWELTGPGGKTFMFHQQPRYIADDLLTLKYAVLGGTGATVLPDYMCREELASGRLVHALPGWAPTPGIFHAVFPSRRGLVPAVRRFLDFLAENVTGNGEIAGICPECPPA
jgi:DNA-binding transcriptional LysR family regulator